MIGVLDIICFTIMTLTAIGAGLALMWFVIAQINIKEAKE